ncbi:hypothetical protein F5884DRAFT_139053 [Xylogone sp. PMI_703]|nr:hypothetical protein F5884DRAFT_139053 [Xylogone sp. PMI_703]
MNRPPHARRSSQYTAAFLNIHCLLFPSSIFTYNLMASDTPTRVRFKTKIQDDYSERHAAQILGIPYGNQQGDRVLFLTVQFLQLFTGLLAILIDVKLQSDKSRRNSI